MLNFGASKPRVKGGGARAPGVPPLDPHLNIEYICLKNNAAHLYLILGRTKLCLVFFSSLLIDAPDVHSFPTVQMVKIQFLLENV